MKWLFVKRMKQKSPFRMQHYLGKLLLKASCWAGKASTRTLAIIPNYSTLISPWILWFSQCSRNVTREHQVQVTSQWDWDDDSACWRRRKGSFTDPQPILLPISEKAPLSLSLKNRAFNETFKQWLKTIKDSAPSNTTVRWGWQQPWKRKKGTVRKMGWKIMLQTAVRTTAFSLKICLISSRLTSACSRKNPKLPPSVTVTGYLWSSSKRHTELVFSSSSVSLRRFSSASVAICHKICQKLCKTSAELLLNIHKEENTLKTEHFWCNHGVTNRKRKGLNAIMRAPNQNTSFQERMSSAHSYSSTWSQLLLHRASPCRRLAFRGKSLCTVKTALGSRTKLNIFISQLL